MRVLGWLSTQGVRIFRENPDTADSEVCAERSEALLKLIAAPTGCSARAASRECYRAEEALIFTRYLALPSRRLHSPFLRPFSLSR